MAQARQDQAAGGHLAGADALVDLACDDGDDYADDAGDGVHGQNDAPIHVQPLRHGGGDNIGSVGEEAAVAEENQQAEDQQEPTPGSKASFRLFHNFTFLLSGAAAPPPNRLKRVCLSFLSPSRVLPDVPAGMSRSGLSITFTKLLEKYIMLTAV